MGRRKKAAKKIVQKKKHVVPTQFKCLFCNSEGSVACKLSLVTMVGQLQCRVCDARFETQINSLTDPIDVFSEWLDEAEELQEQHNKKMAAAAAAGGDGTGFEAAGDGDEGGVEMVEPAAKRARTEEPAAAEPDLSEPNFDVLKGLEVDSNDEEGEKKEEAESKEDDAGPDEDEGEDEGAETWKDVASPVPPTKDAAAPQPEATQPQADTEATQLQTGDEDLF